LVAITAVSPITVAILLSLNMNLSLCVGYATSVKRLPG
jgi:hypothetical protein